jgi:plasmid stabilization system protein ParE
VPVTIQILEAADKEWTKAALWYEGQSPGLGNRFIEMVEKKLDLISKYPDRYPKRKGNFREALVNIFPYIIVYSFHDREQAVVVSSIFHASRNPIMKYRK